VAEMVRRGRLRWFGHVAKMWSGLGDEMQRLAAVGDRGKDRPRKTLNQCVEEDLGVFLLNDVWRKGIHGGLADLRKRGTNGR
jgi:hypothetical protein